MGVQKITFDGANVTAKVDADLYHFLFSQEVGVVEGLKSSVSYTLSNNVITFKDGYIAVYGRIIYIESNTTIKLTPDSVKSGYVVLGVNTDKNEVSIYLKEQSGSYPVLSQSSLIDQNGLYELVLCAYKKTTISITIDHSYQRSVIKSMNRKLDELRSELRGMQEPKMMNLSRISNGVYRTSGMSSDLLMNALVVVVINNNMTLTIPGYRMFRKIGSSTYMGYSYQNTEYTLYLNYESGNLTFTCSNTNHQVTEGYIY